MKKTLISLLAFCLLVTLSQLKAQTAVDAGFDRFICQGNCVVLNGNYIAGGGGATYNVAQIPYSPPQLCGGAPIPVNVDDIWSNVINLPFSFTFYGITYNQCVISSNGLVSFDIANANGMSNWAINQGIPGNQDMLNSIACPFHDILPNGGDIGYIVRGSAPNRVFQVYWNFTPMFSCTTLTTTQAIVMYEGTNVIETYIQDKPLCTAWNGGAAIHGIQDATGTQANVVPGRNFPTQWTATNDAWRFTPSGSSATDLTWFANGVQVGTGNYLQVCPSVTTTYTLRGTSATGTALSDDITVDVTGVSSFTVNTSQVNNGCFGGTTATATATTVGGTGTFDYQWSPIPQTTSTVTGLESGIYTVFVSNSNDFNCASEHLYNITGGSEIIVCAATITPVTCSNPNNGSATLSFSGGQGNLGFAWSTVPAQTTLTATGLSAGTYTITASDANSCTATTQVTLNPPPPPPFIFVSGDDLICPSETTVFTADNFFGAVGTYTWTGPNGYTASGPNATVSLPGIYTAVFTDPLGCTSTASLLLNNYPVGQAPCVDCSLYSVNTTPTATTYIGSPIPITTILNGPPVCASYRADPLAYSPITVPNNAQVIALTDEQVSQLLPIDFNFNFYCSDYDSFHIASNGFINFTGGNSFFNQNIPDEVAPNELIALAWGDLDPGAGGQITYFTTGTAPNRQLVVSYDSVSFYNDTLGFVTGQIVLHEGTNLIDIITTNIDNSNSRSLTQGIENIDGSQATAVSGRNGAIWSAQNNAWRFTPSALYNWSPSAGLSDATAPSPIANQPSTYILTVTIGNCSFLQTVTINPPCSISAQQSVEACEGTLASEATVVSTGGTMPYTYAWSNTLTNSTITGLAAGTLTVTASDAAGCTATATVTITELPTPVVNAFINTPGITLDTIYSGSQAIMFVAPADPNTTYTWSPVEFLNVVAGANVTTTPTSLGLITYTVVGERQGCTASDQVELLVIANQFRPANAFTPNGDENNDTFFPIVNGNVVIKSFKVFDRWGHTVHDSSITGWDGTYKGEVLPRDSYIYVMTIRYPERSADEIVSGDVTLLR